MNKVSKFAGTLTAATLAVGGAAMPALAANASQEEAPLSVTAETVGAVSTSLHMVKVANVQGEFSASQETVTPLATIANMFQRATAAMCASLPDYDLSAMQGKITVMGDVDNPFDATVSEMAEEGEASSYTLKCACASNIPGGGAIANAQVEGVSLASIVALAGA